MKKTTARKGLIGLCAVALAGTGIIAPPLAQASPAGYSVAERTADGVTADVLPTTQIDGVAYDQAIAGNTVYVGGEFTNARPAGADPGTQLTPRANLLAYDLTTGELVTSFQADTNARVNAIAVSPDGSRVYVGGQFTTVGGQTRYRIAAFDTTTRQLVSSWQPSLDASVYSIVATNDTVYVGGGFSQADGQPRQRLAAFDAHTGALLDWAPTADNLVRGMALTPDGSRVVIGGMFGTVNGSTAIGTASLDATTGAMYPFAMNKVIPNHGTSSGVYSLKSDGRHILGTAYNYGGDANSLEGSFMADAMTGEPVWLANCVGDSYDITSMASTVYTVSHEHGCAPIGGFARTRPENYHRANSFTYEATGTNKSGVSGYPEFGGYAAPSMKAWHPDVMAGSYTGLDQGGWTIESNSDYVVMGGEFPRIDGVKQQGLARFAKPGTAPSKVGPVGGTEMTPTVTVDGQSVTATWKATVDSDNLGLDYRLVRTPAAGGAGTVVASTSAESQWWVRPTLTLTEKDVPAGDWTYKVVAQDADGNKAYSTPVAVTVASAAPVVSPTAATQTTAPVTKPTATATTTKPTATATATKPTTTTPAPRYTNYPSAVRGARPAHYWRMDEATGVALADQVGANPMDSYKATRRSPGVFSRSGSVGFRGVVGSGAADRRVDRIGNNASQELWFKTTSTKGGVMMDLSAANRTGYSRSDDRVLYLTRDGRVAFSVRTSATSIASRAAISSGAHLNNGKWHHVVATMGTGGMHLFVDGRQVASATRPTVARLTSGYWRLGGDSISYLASAPASSWFTGSIDEVAVYNSQLPAATVALHATVGR